ncbi:MAG: acetylxylan esterase [Verrucomicrobiae bacterium]|nr:acetylxylan esterase [Verrucomicrobiae bacterium]
MKAMFPFSFSKQIPAAFGWPAFLAGLMLAFAWPQSGMSNTAPSPATNYTMVIQTDRSDALYKVGEKVTFKVILEINRKPADATKVRYEMIQDGIKEAGKGELEIVSGKGSVSWEWKQPSFILLKVLPPIEKTDAKPTLAGAGCEPEKIAPSMPKPDDFDSFWNAKKTLADALPKEPSLTPIAALTDNQIETHVMVMDNINGAKIRGFFAKPAGNGPFPAILLVYPAGVYSIKPADVAAYARRGAMAVNINPHDIENEKPDQYYNNLRSGALKDYQLMGRDDRETCYFLRMFCACYRAAQYLASRTEWDGRHLVVHGSSMGGGQAIAAAALCPKVTAFASNVPALCDHTGREAGRAAGWPRIVNYTDDKADPKQLNAARYFDCVNFAPTIQARALVSAGFIDTTCPPSSVYAAFNALKCEKNMLNTPRHGHVTSSDWNNTRDPFISRELGEKPKSTGSLDLTLPPLWHGIPGLKTSLYYDNIILAENSSAYRFTVNCDIGQSEKRCWSVTPSDKDVGDHPLVVTVKDAAGQTLGETKTILRITSHQAGEGKPLRLLVIGDSLTQATLYPNELARLLSLPHNPSHVMLGAHIMGNANPGVAHEGYSGSTWKWFLTQYSTDPKLPADKQRSPFVFAGAGGKPAIDVTRYLREKCGDTPPDLVTFLLGINDCFRANPGDRQAINKTIDDMFANAEALLKEFRRAAPKASFGICLVTPPNASEQAFIACHKDKYTRWGWKRIQHRLVQRQLQQFGGREAEKIFVIPTELGIDPVDGYPKDNSVHPNQTGYQQIAASIYSWIKWWLIQG